METVEKDIALFEGERATNYDGFVQQWIPNYDYFMSMLPKILGEAKEESVLVVGSGTGNEILALANQNKAWSIFGVDPSPEMIAIAKKKLKGYPNVKLLRSELKELSHQDLFGAATLVLVLHFIKYPSEKLRLLKEIERRLKPGAPFIVMGIFGTNQQIQANLDILEYLLPPTLAQREIEERFDRIKNQLHRNSEEELNKLLARAGFEVPTRFFQASIYSAWLTKKIQR